MDILIAPDGTARCLYGEMIELAALGKLDIRRASYVEPDEQGRWWADLSPTGGPRLGPFTLRSAALENEAAWITSHVILSSQSSQMETT